MPVPDEELRARCAQHGIFWISRHIAQGMFPSAAAYALLSEAGVTHLVNLDRPYTQADQAHTRAFAEALWLPIVDLRRMPDRTALDTLDRLHVLLSQPGATAFVHCHAGMNRSPTLLFLYFIACGIEPGRAREWIEEASPNAIPGHPSLCDDLLVQLVDLHGQRRYRPLARPELLEPV